MKIWIPNLISGSHFGGTLTTPTPSCSRPGMVPVDTSVWMEFSYHESLLEGVVTVCYSLLAMEIDVDRIVDYWKKSSAYDLETGRTLLNSARYPYALFFGHLAIEKLLKSLVVKATGQHAPFSHSLPLLASKTGLSFSDDIMDRLAEFMEFQIEARYPDASMEFYHRCTDQFARCKFDLIEETYQWLMER